MHGITRGVSNTFTFENLLNLLFWSKFVESNQDTWKLLHNKDNDILFNKVKFTSFNDATPTQLGSQTPWNTFVDMCLHNAYFFFFFSTLPLWIIWSPDAEW